MLKNPAGVPANSVSSETPAPAQADAVNSSGSRYLARQATVQQFPGLAACSLAAVTAITAAGFLPTVSPLLVAIVLGVALRNTVRLPATWDAGLLFSSKKLLRAGIVLMGLQLVLSDILALGPGMLVVVVAVVVVGIAGTYLAGRLLKLSVTQSLLIASGFSICGAAAVAAADGVLDAEEEEVVTAVALVVIFGTLMIPLVPAASSLFGLDNAQAGLWAGASIHEVAQVVAVGGMLGGGALGAAVVVKLARVLMLAPVMAVLGLFQRHSSRDSEISGRQRPPIIPLFVVGFVAMAALRSTEALPAIALEAGKMIQTFLLTAAMFALGCGVKASLLKKAGVRPFILGAFSTVLVASVAFGGVLLVS
jgi:uncharacterized integral membrane protein (TIGR00698 family)